MSNASQDSQTQADGREAGASTQREIDQLLVECASGRNHFVRAVASSHQLNQTQCLSANRLRFVDEVNDVVCVVAEFEDQVVKRLGTDRIQS